MCLGTVTVGDPAAPTLKVEDVIDVSFEGTGAVVRTLFGETQSLAGVRCRQIDMGKGVHVFLEEIR